MQRLLPLIVPVTIAAGLLGAALSDQPVLVIVLSGAVGAVVAFVLGVVLRRRIDRVADDVTRLAEQPRGRPPRQHGPEWRPLIDALQVVGGSMSRQVAEVAEERSRVVRLLERLPPAVLLFTGERLDYANATARRLFALDGDAPRTPMQILGVQALADAVTESRETTSTVEVEVDRAGRALHAAASVTTAGEVALVVRDLTVSRRVDAMRRDFVVNASHELKTPVAGIQALAESLGMAFTRDPQRAQRMIVRMQDESARLATLVRDLLDLTRLEEASGGHARRHVDLCEIVRGQVRRFTPLAAERRVRIRCELADQARIVAVPEDLRLIAANLLENAIRYNRDAGEVVVSVRRETDAAVLEVADSGIGIPAADHDRIFERFYRVDKGRSRAAGGTGLGLSLVRHAAERHGGVVTVDSVLGEGATFRVRLPVAEPE